DGIRDRTVTGVQTCALPIWIPVLAHGGTGRSNDSLRVDTGVLTLSPEMRVLAPVRDWGLTREAELEYVRAHGIEVSATPSRSYRSEERRVGKEGGARGARGE